MGIKGPASDYAWPSVGLTKEELRLPIQGIRDCEQKSFRDKEISIWIYAPELST